MTHLEEKMTTKRKHLAVFVSLLTVAFMLFSGFTTHWSSIRFEGNMLETTCIKEGNVCNITGTISFDRGAYKISACVVDGYSNVYQTATWRTNCYSTRPQTIYLQYTNINYGIHFENLATGNYKLIITAEDWPGNCTTNVYTFTISRIGMPVTSNSAYSFVRNMYDECLKRPYSESEVESWAYNLSRGYTSAATVAVGFFESAEFLGKNLSNEEFVTRLYKALLHRDPDQGGYNSWLYNLNHGMNRHTVIYYFVASDEFTRLCNNYGIVRGYVY